VTQSLSKFRANIPHFAARNLFNPYHTEPQFDEAAQQFQQIRANPDLRALHNSAQMTRTKIMGLYSTPGSV
jgi:hypothetical protein